MHQRQRLSGAHRALVVLHQVDAALVALVAAEGGLQEGVDEGQSLFLAVLAGADGHDVRVVVLAGQTRGRIGPHEGGAHAFHAVGGHLLAVARAADDDAEAARLIDDSLCGLNAERRVVVERIVGMSAMVDDIVTGLAQVRNDLLLEFETGVIGADMNAHGILLKSSQTSNAH